MTNKESEDFFKLQGEGIVGAMYGEFRLEQVYQAFKARLLKEVGEIKNECKISSDWYYKKIRKMY